MKKILVLNCGSSSIKYRLFDSNFSTLLDGLIEKIGEEGTQLIHNKGGETLKRSVNVKNHKEGINLMLKMLHDEKWGAIKKIDEILSLIHI